MKDRADFWYMEYVEGWASMTWGRFCELLLAKFTPIDKEDILIEFSNLFYENDMDQCHERFEELKAFGRAKYPMLDDDFFMSKFLGDLPLKLWVECKDSNYSH